MDGVLPPEFVDEVRNRIDLVNLVSEYLHLKKAGRNYQGLCPFHAEKTPSFSVSHEKQFFYCFGCGEGGNIFTFVMKMEGLSFPEAVRHLAGRAGMRLPESVNSPAEEQKKRLLSALKLAAGYYQKQLVHPEKGLAAREYIKKRGLGQEIVARFGLGFAPDAWDGLKSFLLSKKCGVQDLIKAGLLTENENNKTYDRFRSRVLFPIANQRGEVIAFGGRILGEGSPKYLNSPETPLFDKSRNLYALHLARESIRREKKALIFEGYMDVLIAHQAGFTNSVATLGTSLTESQARMLRNQAEEVIIVYDADTAGQAATWRGLQVLRQAGCMVRVGRLPEGLDPDDYIRTRGAESFKQEILAKSLLLVDYQLAALALQYNLNKTDERIRFSEKVIDVLAAIDNAVEREDYLQKASSLLQVRPESLRTELKKASTGLKDTANKKNHPVSVGVRSSITELALIQIFATCSQHPELIQSCLTDITQEDIPPHMRNLYNTALNGGHITPSRLYDLLTGEHQRLLSSLLLEEYELNTAKKVLEDCIKRLKCVRIAAERKEIELQMAKLDSVSAKGEISELSRRWLELRRLEETLNRPREGGKGVG
ncbi:MAG: DNA primase [Dethiobacter sp.]|jgi:DNA primase|nr:DNA primase [Dethiobacter sp.]